MPRRPAIAGLLIAALAALTPPARAQTAIQTIKSCENTDPATTIQGCTGIIDAGPDMGALLFEAYHNRALAELKTGATAAAIADISAAIAINPENEKLYLIRAQAALDQQMPGPAIADATKAATISPADPLPLELRGIAERANGDLARDIADQTAALTLSPDDPNALRERELAQTALQSPGPALAAANPTIELNGGDQTGEINALGREAKAAMTDTAHAAAELNLGQFAAAVRDSGAAIKLFPSVALNYTIRAAADLNLGRTRDAMADADIAIKLDPHDGRGFLVRGLAEGALAQWQNDADDQTTALRLDAGLSAAYLERAVAEHHLNQPDAVLADASTAIKQNPHLLSGYVILADLYADQQNWPAEIAVSAQLIQQLTATRKTAPSLLAFAYVTRGAAYRANHQPALGLADESHAIAAAPRWADAYAERARTEATLDQTDAEIADDSQAIALDPKNVSAYDDRANAYGTQRRYALAVADETILIQLIPNGDVYWNNRCWFKSLAGDFKAALPDCEQSLHLVPKAAATLDSTGFVYLGLHDDKNAIASYTAALAQDPTMASSYWGRALAERNLGHTLTASTDFTTAKHYDSKISSDFGT